MAFTKGLIPDAGNAVRDRDARQAAAGPEGTTPNADDAVGDRDVRQTAAATKCSTYLMLMTLSGIVILVSL